MGNDKETRARLQSSAKQEFLEKGYMQASLRNICKNAGVTTGALYFFFKDKEDLFASLVEEPIKMLYHVMNEHYQEETVQAEDGMIVKEDFSDDLAAARQVIHYIYQYRDEFRMVLTKGQGTKFERTVEKFVAITEHHYRTLADKIADEKNVEHLDDYIIHWTAHMHIDIFVHMISHETSEEEAWKHMETIIRYLLLGWFGMFR